jgi:outer membrane murein-binding lipoprotein Lpp
MVEPMNEDIMPDEPPKPLCKKCGARAATHGAYCQPCALKLLSGAEEPMSVGAAPDYDEPPEREKRSIVDSIKVPAIAAIVVFIIGTILVGMMGGGSLVTKDDFTTNIQGITKAIDDMKVTLDTSVADYQRDIKTVTQSIQGSVDSSINNKVADLNARIVALEAIGGKLDTLNSTVTELSQQKDAQTTSINGLIANIQSLQDELDDATERLEELEENTVPSGTTDSSLVVATISPKYDYLYEEDGESYCIMRVTVENNTGKPIEGVILGIGMTIHSGTTPTTATVTGGQGWKVYPSKLYYRTAGWGYTIQAGKKLHFEVTATFNDIDTPPYSAEVFVEEWSYK